MKKQILLFGTLCLTYGSISAQQLSAKLKDYSPSVVIKVYDVSQKIPLGLNEQLKLAQHFVNEEKSIAKAVLLPAPAQTIDKIKLAYLEDFHSFLKENSQLENYYSSKTDDPKKYMEDSLLRKEGILLQKSIYSTILANKDTLNLTAQQIDVFRNKAADYLHTKKAFLIAHPSEDFNKTIDKDLKDILTDAQLKIYMELKYSKEAKSWANRKWKELEKYNLAEKYNSTATKDKIYKYLLERLVVRGLLNDDLEKRDQVLEALTEARPKELKELDAEKRNKAKNQSAMKNSFAW